MSNTVHVKGISAQTTEEQIRECFSFCGTIRSISVTPDSGEPGSSQSATVTFVKQEAADTAVLLDKFQLGPAQVSVSWAAPLDHPSSGKTGSDKAEEELEHEITQEDKPRSRIFAEYLAQGYVLSDKAIQRAIDIDNQHGASTRFINALQQFDQRYKATKQLQAVDQKYNISQQAQQAWLGFTSFFDKATGTPTGQRIRQFYNQGQKQVLDVHNEAKHLAGLKKGKSSSTVDTLDQGLTGGYASEKTPLAGQATAESAGLKKVSIDGQERTKCNCGGVHGNCPCAPSQCACTGCSKAS